MGCRFYGDWFLSFNEVGNSNGGGMSLREMKRLECPKCMGELRETTIGDKKGNAIAVDQCYGCSGIWFDKGEFRNALKLKLYFQNKETAEKIEGEWRDVVFDLKTARCPICKKDMERIKNTRGGGVVVDHCLVCDGTWLDGGEIRLLMKGRPIHKVMEYVVYHIEDAFHKHALPQSRLKENKVAKPK